MKLSIVDGIIQDDFLGRVPIVRSIIEPQGVCGMCVPLLLWMGLLG